MKNSSFPKYLSEQMSDAPADFLRDIFSRLSTELLFRCRSVCKAWRNIIDDPLFGRIHMLLHRNRQSFRDQVIIRNQTGNLYSFSLNSLVFSGETADWIYATNIKNVMRPGFPRITDFPVPYCDGLILISQDDEKKTWAVWNPLTGESLEFPAPDDDKAERLGCKARVGLGYDPTTNDYKVVSIGQGYGSDKRSIMLKTLVYSLKLGNWKEVKNFPNCCAPHMGYGGVCLNGALHWITTLSHQPMYVIISLNLGTENFNLMKMPWDLPGVHEDCFHYVVKLDVLSESLFLSCYIQGQSFDVWMMKEYDGENTWTMLFSLKRNIVSRSWRFLFTPRVVAYLSSKEQVLIQYNDGDFLWFDVKKQSLKKVTIKGIKSSFTPQVFRPSLLRLQNSGGTDKSIVVGETANRKRKRPADLFGLEVWWLDD